MLEKSRFFRIFCLAGMMGTAGQAWDADFWLFLAFLKFQKWLLINTD